MKQLSNIGLLPVSFSSMKKKCFNQIVCCCCRYDLTDRDWDEWSHNLILFVGITLCFGIGGLYIAYLPDFKGRDWAMRQAYLELDRRRKAGEPLISPDLIPASEIHLPSDEELGDTEIII